MPIPAKTGKARKSTKPRNPNVKHNFYKYLKPEDHIHAAGLRYAAYQYPGLIVYHYPNEGVRSDFEKYLYVALGAKSGFADLMLFHGGKVGFIEIKTETGKPTPKQKQFIELMLEQKHFARITYGIDQLIKAIDDFMEPFKKKFDS